MHRGLKVVLGVIWRKKQEKGRRDNFKTRNTTGHAEKMK
jgi:hypothetical protein